ncbi:MAG: helix-turn-helix domain-containing protein [Dysosmobacter sp.]|nr:helix-turn-helix domain-containing protein [Dysosmobacter sp.]
MSERENALLTIDELCSALMIGRNTAYRLLNSGAIKAFRIGRCWKIPKTAVHEFLGSSHTVL